MFHYFGILEPSSSEEEILAAGIETPRNSVRQKPFFGGNVRDVYDDRVALPPPVTDAGSTPPVPFVALFMSPYV